LLIPLIGHRFAVDGEYNLPVASKLPPYGYFQKFLQKQESHEVDWFLKGQNAFKMHLRLVSSVYVQDKRVGGFMKTFPAKLTSSPRSENEHASLAHMPITRLEEALPYTVVNFMVPLFNYLFEVISVSPIQIYASSAFLGVVQIAER
jgi:hypothetical protein